MEWEHIQDCAPSCTCNGTPPTSRKDDLFTSICNKMPSGPRKLPTCDQGPSHLPPITPKYACMSRTQRVGTHPQGHVHAFSPQPLPLRLHQRTLPTRNIAEILLAPSHPQTWLTRAQGLSQYKPMHSQTIEHVQGRVACLVVTVSMKEGRKPPRVIQKPT